MAEGEGPMSPEPKEKNKKKIRMSSKTFEYLGMEA